jgi:membrane-bound metal-dependent hydrolase YbcI (DUF457 family)
MYLLCHLAAGLVIGILLFWYFRDPVLIVAAALGGILPDLIDKPLGHIILKNSLDYGRIYGHGVIFFLLVLLAGLLAWHRWHSVAGIALALGVLSHEFLDVMWMEPANWYYPFLGPFQSEHITDFFAGGLLRELSNPSEWMFAAAVLLLILGFSAGRIGWVDRHPRTLTVISLLVAAFIGGTGFLVLLSGPAGIGQSLTGLHSPADILITGAVMVVLGLVAGACVLRDRGCRI